ncbi:Major Facilitator Superfamily protein [Yoonia rosea]|uniref:Major Facilitator Superfamily protein n=1 Tax=Yoonia rosea TaxID=287098 RepID=A0A1R3WYL5_9RHOB|nr:MFS transporter [Yoonia rosea]SIT83672.1 Major Facilitator Superfamily protein [Yoonia rosea]
MSILNALSLSRRPATAFVVIGMFWGCFAAYVPVIKAQLGASDALFGALLLGSATGLVSSMWLAPRADRILGSRAMQVGAALLAFAWLFPGQVTVPLVFALSMALVGLASGLLDVVMNARVSELEARHNRPLMNANHAMFSVAYAVGALIVGATREAGLPPAPVFAGFGVIAILLLPMMRMDVTYVDAEEGYAGAYPLWPIILCGAIVLVAFMSEATVEAWSALHVERTLGGGAAEGALGPAMLGITMAIGRFSGQVVAERLREIPVVIGAAAISAIGAVVAALAPTPFVAYIGFGVLGLGVSVIGPMGLALVGKLVAPHLRTEAISRTAVIGFSGFFFAPVLMGLLSDAFGLRVAFVAVAVLLLSVVPIAIFAKRLPVR